MGQWFTAVDVLKARRAVSGAIERTPLTHSKGLSDLSGAEVYIKWENLQKTGSYKVRGALYRMSLLSEEERRKGVITASAGNWALGVALGAKSLGISATICVPANTPKVKVDKCEALGAEVVLHGSYFDEAFAHCQEVARGGGKTFVSGTDDFNVMAGHGTVGLEILEDLPDVSEIVCPVGGAGLLSGIATWAKTVNPYIKIIGAQSTAARTLHECFKAKRLVDVPVPPTICEGLAGGITQLNLDLALHWLDDVVLAEEERVKDAIIWLMRNERQIAEGSGAVGPAAILQGRLRLEKGEKVAVVISGGNIDLDRLGIS
ncbi:MAG: threonine/serine dehydratase [Thermoplasmata archaeon]